MDKRDRFRGKWQSRRSTQQAREDRSPYPRRRRDQAWSSRHARDHRRSEHKTRDREPRECTIGNNRNDGRKIRFSMLKEMTSWDPGKIIMELSDKNVAFGEALKQSKDKDDWIRLLLRILAKACTSRSAPAHLLDIFVLMIETSFIDTVTLYFLKMATDVAISKQDDLKQDIKDIMVLLKEFSIQMPESVTQFLGILNIVQEKTDTLRETTDLIDEEIVEAIHNMNEKKQKLFQPKIKEPGENHDATELHENFRRIQIFPQTADIEAKNGPFLRKNRAKGAYESTDQYLDIQFRLLREDFIGPLRDGIAGYIKDKSKGYTGRRIQDIRLYYNVKIIAPGCSDRGLCHLLQFDVRRLRRVIWARSKRLIFGSLVCLSQDDFKTFKFATVTSRNPSDLNQGIIQVCFEHDNDTVNEMMGHTYTMAETTAHFESYRHVLEALKQNRQGDLPFEEYIVSCKSTVKPPIRLQKDPYMQYDLQPLKNDHQLPALKGIFRYIWPPRWDSDDDGFLESDLDNGRFKKRRLDNETPSKVTLLDKATWPRAHTFQLDDSQYKALHSALTKELALIQGPPGTGKTYIGLKIVKALLHNRRHRDPILVVCYTNHALDQFLEGIVKFLPKGVLRVGRRSSSPILEPYSLGSQRRIFHQEDSRSTVARRHHRQKMKMKKLSRQINVQSCKITMARANILHEEFLQTFMGFAYDQLTEQFEAMRTERDVGEDMTHCGRFSVIVAWLGIGFQMTTDTKDFDHDQKQNNELEGGDIIDVTSEADAVQRQRQIDDLEDDIQLELSKLTADWSQKDKKNPENEDDAEINNFCQKAIALNITNLDQQPKYMSNDKWRMQKSKWQKLKKAIQQLIISTKAMDEDEIVYDLWQMKYADRWRLYCRWVNDCCSSLMRETETARAEYEQVSRRYREILLQEDKEIIDSSDVVGMTTTGAARYRTILQEISPRIIIVEEAAEVLEAHVITSLNKGCEHLILIGDHKQLKPNPTVYELARKYNLDMSLFERLINNGVAWDCLELQHRMRPEIADLLKPIYKNLKNHKDVTHYENIKGVSQNVFFINHSEPEQQDDDLRSSSNKHEAEYLVRLCNFLLQQGYRPSQITILTLYSGQMFCLRNLLPKGRYEGVRLAVVDNYQGEENDIILLSLVRSNSTGQIGFLKSDNRICVALSRAKMGLFVIGNFDLLASCSRLWKDITIQMKRRKLMGGALKLTCQNHPNDDGILAFTSKDFDKAPNGGCRKSCDYRLECGHRCRKLCHEDDADHLEYVCEMSCARRCPENHRCKRKCYQDCGKCHEPCEKKLRTCGHSQNVPCYMDAEDFECRKLVKINLPCGHQNLKRCGLRSSPCEFKINHQYPCGHISSITCGKKESAVCSTPCNALLDCGHFCISTCGECHYGALHTRCTKSCERILICGHRCQESCSVCPPCTKKCRNRCRHSKCWKKCGELCVSCKEPCEWKCRHYKCNMLCCEPCDRPRCNEPCTKKLKCGHTCIGLCGEPCPFLCRRCDKNVVEEILFGDEDEPDARFILLEDCKHIIEYKAMDKYMDDTTDQNENGEIQLKVCPKCKTTIRQNNRYGSIINKTLQDIESVKKIILGNRDKVQVITASTYRAVHKLLDSDDRLSMLDQWRDKYTQKSEQAFLAFDNQLSIVKALENIEQDFKKIDCAEFEEDLLTSKKQLKAIKRWALKERNLLTTQELRDAKTEVKRLDCFCRLLLYQ